MAIPQINPYDYFYQWREKTNLLATLVGDIETIDVALADRDTLVEALNKVISNIGPLATLTTTAKNTIVAAINEHQTKLGNTTLTTTAQDVTSAINELDGDIGIPANLTTTAKNNLVAAVNELDGEHGTLSSLTTTYKATFVGAINELDNEMGDLTTLKTTTKSSTVHAINELFDSLLIGNATFTVGSESTDVIRVTVQLKDRSASNLTIAAGVQAYLSDNADGSTVVATAPSGGWAIGTTGAMIEMVAGKAATFICSSSGVFNVDITEAGAKTAYLVVILPLGNLKISSEITFAA